MEATTATDADEFCLVLSPTRWAASRASEAVRQRFRSLAEATRIDLAAVVEELVGNSLEHGPGRPITVTVAVGADSIRGEVADHGNPVAASPRISKGAEGKGSDLGLVDRLTSRWAVYEGSTDVWFEMPVEPRPA
jgi:anti-sigma regulatory factor (Ser/Thr protein kinase)